MNDYERLVERLEAIQHELASVDASDSDIAVRVESAVEKVRHALDLAEERARCGV